MSRTSGLRRVTAALALCVAGAGCEYLGLTPEAKINAAVPLSAEVELKKAQTLAALAADRRDALEREFATRMKLRALSCSRGYAPPWHASKSEVSQRLADRSCFVDADAELSRWIGLRRAGIVLAMPPLRPIPASPQKILAATGQIRDARFPAEAGALVVATYDGLEVVDWQSAQVLFREAKSAGQLGDPSPNGRLFVTGADGAVRIRDAESGAILVEFPKVSARDFHWLDHRTAVYGRGEGKTAVVDFENGREAPLTGLRHSVALAARLPGGDGTYVLGTPGSLAKVQVQRSASDTTARLLDEKPTEYGWSTRAAGVTSDGKHVFHAGKDLTLTPLDTFEQRRIALGPMRFSRALPMPDPDKILLAGNVQLVSSRDSGPKSFVYSISADTFTPVAIEHSRSEKFLYAPSLKRLAQLSDGKVSLVEDLPLGEPMSGAQLVGAALTEENNRKLEQAERDAEAVRNLPKLLAESEARRAAAASGVAAPAPARAPMAAAPTGSAGILAELARDAQVEAVGVYQGANAALRAGEARKAGIVEVRVRRTAKPLVLVLSSYERVRWILVSESGARLSAVIISGYHQSQVVGAGNARIVASGRSYAYEASGPKYSALDGEVRALTGKPIALFQGRYEASSFSVGGG